MNQPELVRFEEVTPTLLRVAFFDGHLASLISHLKLPIYGGYDGLDEMVFAFLTLPSGKTVVLGEYANSPRTGVDLYVDSKLVGIPAAIYESCQQLGMPKNQVVWFRDKFQVEIDKLFAEQGDVQLHEKITGLEIQSVIYDPIACFQHSLGIYNRAGFPEYWAMLQHNLGLAYADRTQGDRLMYLERATECFKKAQAIFTHDNFPAKWEINEHDLKKFEEEFQRLDELKQSLVKDIFDQQISGRNLQGVDLSFIDMDGLYARRSAPYPIEHLRPAYLRDADLKGANLEATHLNSADLVGANLREAILIATKLQGANLTGADLSYANSSYADLVEANLNSAKLCYTNLSGALLTLAQLRSANLSHSNLSYVNLSRTDLSNANLSDSNLCDADLLMANLSDADLSRADVTNARFKANSGISETTKQDLIRRGAIFEDSAGDRSPVPR
jgi:uncharacterized protein YjbI with pentapeptide repeats